MNEESKATLERQARHVAKLGMTSVENLEAVIARARELLEAGQIVPPPNDENPYLPQPYAWQLTEPQLDLPRRVWLATVEDFATGQGHSVYFAAGFAHDEDLALMQSCLPGQSVERQEGGCGYAVHVRDCREALARQHRVGDMAKYTRHSH